MPALMTNHFEVGIRDEAGVWIQRKYPLLFLLPYTLMESCMPQVKVWWQLGLSDSINSQILSYNSTVTIAIVTSAALR